MSNNSNPLAEIRNQTLAIDYAPLVRKNNDIIEDHRVPMVSEESAIQIPLVDIYVNDGCNLRCEFCPTIFGKNNLPLEAVPLIAKLRPRVITLTGGGEPSIYRYKRHKIEDFISAIRDEIGMLPIGMMSNGVELMPSKAINELSWLRISINASNRESYKDVHKKDRLNKVLKNIVQYLKMHVEKVGVAFVYTPKSINEIPSFVKVICDNVFPNITYEEQKKLTLQFRPVADKTYNRYTTSYDERNHLTESIAKLPQEAKCLLNEQSNILEVLRNECFTLQGMFHACYISLLQMNIDAKGDAYPCPQMAHASLDTYGNIFNADFFNQLKERIRESVKKHTRQSCTTCSQAKINNIYSQIDLNEFVFDKQIKPVFF